MSEISVERLWRRLAGGRTDVVIDLLAAGVDANGLGPDQGTMLGWAAYFGDVAAVRLVVSRGAKLTDFGVDLGLHGAAFHGHWQLCQFLLEQGAPVAALHPETNETGLHAALCTDADGRHRHDAVLRVLLEAGADVRAVTRIGASSGAFMREARTRGETALHRAAACGTEATIRLLLAAGADPAAVDGYGDTPLGWASWHRRPVSILRLLCHHDQRIHPDYKGMREHLAGVPLSDRDLP